MTSLFSSLPKRPQMATTMVGAGGGIYPLALERAAYSAPAFWMAGSGDGEEDGVGRGNSSGDGGGLPSLPIPTPAVFQTLRPLGSVAVSLRRPPSAEEGHEEHAAGTVEVEEGQSESAQGSSPPPEELGGEEEEEEEYEEEVTYAEEIVGEVVLQVQRTKEEQQPQQSSMEAAQQEDVEVEAGAEEPLREADQEGLRRYKLRALVLQDELQRTRGTLEEQARACAAARAEARAFEALAVAREEEMAQTRKVGGWLGWLRERYDVTGRIVAYIFLKK